jgi:hypothetical protein
MDLVDLEFLELECLAEKKWSEAFFLIWNCLKPYHTRPRSPFIAFVTICVKHFDQTANCAYHLRGSSVPCADPAVVHANCNSGSGQISEPPLPSSVARKVQRRIIKRGGFSYVSKVW